MSLDPLRRMKFAGRTDAEAAEEYGVHQTTASRWRRSLGLPPCPNRTSALEAREGEIRGWVAAGVRAAEVARRLGVPHGTAWNFLRVRGLVGRGSEGGAGVRSEDGVRSGAGEGGGGLPGDGPEGGDRGSVARSGGRGPRR